VRWFFLSQARKVLPGSKKHTLSSHTF
jgi:hypothetical protein